MCRLDRPSLMICCYHESIKRGLNRRLIYECRCDEILKSKTEHWVVRGTGTPKERDETNRREVCECDG
jgi:hypothetical protein